MKSDYGKTAEAWNRLFAKYRIREHVRANGKFLIASDQIREFREPRLMAKFDHRKNLPHVFRDSNLGILPVSRGDYIIGPFKLFATHPEPAAAKPLRHVLMPHTIESLVPKSITSEAVALNCAWDSGILHDFVGEEALYPTLSGRMGANPFKFRISDERGLCKSDISVDGAQIEIDAAYEGAHSVVIIEAKMCLAEDFIIRQLYYPFRHFASMSISKSVRTVYLTYSGGVFHLAEYSFRDPMEYNSLSLVKYGRYAIAPSTLKRIDVRRMLESSRDEVEPEGIPFPQADSFERVVNLCERLFVQPMSKEDIEECYGFDPRQADYYYNAAAYLGLSQKEGGRGSRAVLSDRGRQLIALPLSQRNQCLVRRILCHEPFRRTLCDALETGRIPDVFAIREILMETNPNLGDVGKGTYLRRASTVRHWIQWVLDRLID